MLRRFQRRDGTARTQNRKEDHDVPRARNPDVDKAQKLYKVEGRTMKDIAVKLGYPEGTVRYWKSHYKWDASNSVKKNKANVGNGKPKTESKKTNVGKRGRPRKGEERPKKVVKPKRHRGGQKGNLNALGNSGGGPVGNKKALKHGAYSIADWGVLDDEESSLLDTFPDKPIEQLRQDIQLYTIREIRIMKAINKFKGMKGDIYLQGTTQIEEKRRFDNPEEKELYDERIAERVNNGDRLPGRTYTVQTMTYSTHELIIRMEKELSTVQRAKTAAIEALNKALESEAEKNSTSEGNDLVKIWAKAVMDHRKDGDDTDE